MSDNYHEVSDEELLNLAPPEEVDTTTAEEEETPVEEVPEQEEEVSEEESTEETGSAEESESSTDADEEEESGDENASETEEESEEVAAKDDDEPDYRKQVEQILSPFKANGKEMQVDSVEDAVTLMKQGANYNKKMASLKPGMKVLKMLENNELLDERKLSYLIDLHNQDPKAIGKLLKDSKVNPLELEEDENATDYVPSSHAVSDAEIELDAVLNGLENSPHGQAAINTVSTDWDASSRKYMVSNPKYISDLAEHVESGVFQRVSAVVAKEQALGRLSGLSDFEAYSHVGEQMREHGHLDDVLLPKPNVTSAMPAVASSKKRTDPKLNQRKRAASGTKSVASKKTGPSKGYLEMSDEEFEKIASSPYQ